MFSQLSSNSFGSLLLIEMDKNTSTILIATHHIPEAILSCYTKNPHLAEELHQNYSLFSLYSSSVILQYLSCLCSTQAGKLGGKMWTNTPTTFRPLRTALTFVSIPKEKISFIVFLWPFTLWQPLPHVLRNQCGGSANYQICLLQFYIRRAWKLSFQPWWTIPGPGLYLLTVTHLPYC